MDGSATLTTVLSSETIRMLMQQIVRISLRRERERGWACWSATTLWCSGSYGTFVSGRAVRIVSATLSGQPPPSFVRRSVLPSRAQRLGDMGGHYAWPL